MLASIDVDANKKIMDGRRAAAAAAKAGNVVQDQEMQLLNSSPEIKEDNPNPNSRNKRKYNDMGNGVIPNKNNNMN